VALVGQRAQGAYFAEVIAVGDDVTEVRPGDVVIVQAMSANAATEDDPLTGARGIASVPVLPPRKAQTREEELARRQAALKALRAAYPDGTPMTRVQRERIGVEMNQHDKAIREIRASRIGRGRSRLFSAVRDAGTVAEGILAVVEREGAT